MSLRFIAVSLGRKTLFTGSTMPPADSWAWSSVRAVFLSTIPFFRASNTERGLAVVRSVYPIAADSAANNRSLSSLATTPLSHASTTVSFLLVSGSMMWPVAAWASKSLLALSIGMSPCFLASAMDILPRSPAITAAMTPVPLRLTFLAVDTSWIVFSFFKIWFNVGLSNTSQSSNCCAVTGLRMPSKIIFLGSCVSEIGRSRRPVSGSVLHLLFNDS